MGFFHSRIDASRTPFNWLVVRRLIDCSWRERWKPASIRAINSKKGKRHKKIFSLRYDINWVQYHRPHHPRPFYSNAIFFTLLLIRRSNYSRASIATFDPEDRNFVNHVFNERQQFTQPPHPPTHEKKKTCINWVENSKFPCHNMTDFRIYRTWSIKHRGDYFIFPVIGAALGKTLRGII